MSQLSAVGEDNVIVEFWKHINRGLSCLGVDHTLSASGRLLSLIEGAGFQNATEREWRIPVGSWPLNQGFKEAGILCQEILSSGAHEIADLPLRVGLGWDGNDVEELVLAVQRELKHCSKHQLYLPFRVVYAQKPLSS